MPANSSYNGPYRDVVSYQSMHLCSLWRIIRSDGQTEYYTNWDEDIFGRWVGIPGVVFQSAAGLVLSATSRESGLKSQSLAAKGYIDGLDLADLQHGAYTDAVITEWTIDARFPFVMGAVLNSSTYFVTGVTYGDEVWEMQLEGLGRKMKETVGVPFNQQCRFSLGEGHCAPIPPDKTYGVSIAQHTYGNNSGCTISAVDADEPRRVFSIKHGTGSPSLLPQAKLSHGTITFLTGDNAGFTYEVMTQRTDALNINVKLVLQTRSDIKTSDTVKVIAGCSGTWGACTFYKNNRSFGGNLFIPGAQRARQSARSQF